MTIGALDTIGAVATLEDVLNADSAYFRFGDGDFDDLFDDVETPLPPLPPVLTTTWGLESEDDADDAGGGGVTVMI